MLENISDGKQMMSMSVMLLHQALLEQLLVEAKAQMFVSSLLKELVHNDDLTAVTKTPPPRPDLVLRPRCSSTIVTEFSRAVVPNWWVADPFSMGRQTLTGKKKSSEK